MPYVRRFYYLPRDDVVNDTEVLAPCETFWKFEGTSLLSNHDVCNAHTGRPRSFQDLPSEDQVKQLRFKKILGILNKITPKKLQRLILQIGPESMDVTYVKMLAEIIFSKALVDEMYINLYAKLCEELTSTLTSESHECFKKVLIDMCQTGFSHLLELTDNDINSIHQDKRFIFKRRFMSLMRFIGELSCISLPYYDRTYNWKLTDQLIEKGDELHLEAVYFLLFTISLRSTDNAWPEYLWLRVAKLAHGVGPKGESVSARTRFMYLSLVEARIGIVPPYQLPEQSSPTTSDSETNEQMLDYKGF